MATVYLEKNPVQTIGEIPQVGATAADFTLVDAQLNSVSLSQFAGKNVVLNIFPSIDTGVCAASVRRFNTEAAALTNTQVLCISADLPFALGRFCAAEGIDKVQTLSAFRSEFGKKYGLTLADGPLEGLLARCVLVVNSEGKIIYEQLVDEITTEPDYESALNSLR